MQNATLTDKQRAEQLKINDTTVVPYPANELEDLRGLLEYDGILGTIQENTGVTPPTVRLIARGGVGQYAKIAALRDFVKLYRIKFPAA